jgi:hypothetical protein
MKKYFYLICISLLLLFCKTSTANTMALAGTQLAAQVEVSYLRSGEVAYSRQLSNPVYLRVLPVEVFNLEVGHDVHANQGQPLLIPASLQNTGNVAARYRFSLQADAATSFFGSVMLYHDASSNGKINHHDRVLAVTSNAKLPRNELELQPGETVSLLISANAARHAQGKATLRLHVETTNQQTVNVKQIAVQFVQGPSLHLSHRSSSLKLKSGQEIAFETSLHNVGNNDAQITSGYVGKAIHINGKPLHAIVVRSKIPQNMVYVAGSLSSANPYALMIFRTKSDPEWHFHTENMSIPVHRCHRNRCCADEQSGSTTCCTHEIQGKAGRSCRK